MVVKNKKELEAILTLSARRARQVREAAEKIKGALASAEMETTSQPSNLVKPTISPFGERQR